MNSSGVVVVVGGGGREHALARRLKNEPAVKEVHAWPGNAGMAKDGIICHGAGRSASVRQNVRTMHACR